MLDAGVVARISVRVPVGVIAAIVVALVMACSRDDHEEDDTQFRKDVIWCEEAVAHLEDCCGTAFDATQVECRHFYMKDTGCGTTTVDTVDPAYRTDESKCIRELSCEAIRGAQVCERALAAGKARTSHYVAESSSSTSSTTSSSGILGSVSSSSSSGAVSSTSSNGGSAATGPICP